MRSSLYHPVWFALFSVKISVAFIALLWLNKVTILEVKLLQQTWTKFTNIVQIKVCENLINVQICHCRKPHDFKEKYSY